MNFILKYKGDSEPNLARMNDVLQTHCVRIIDGTLLPGIALIELDHLQLEKLKAILPEDWTIDPEKVYPLPDMRKKIKD